LEKLICQEDKSSSEHIVRTLSMNILAHVFPASEEFGYRSEHLHVARRNDIHISATTEDLEDLVRTECPIQDHFELIHSRNL
jgi:hypothetical protein